MKDHNVLKLITDPEVKEVVEALINEKNGLNRKLGEEINHLKRVNRELTKQVEPNNK